MADTQPKFSGGEWYQSNSPKYDNAIDIFANPEKLAVGVGVCEVFGDNFRANARLILVAPKLYRYLLVTSRAYHNDCNHHEILGAFDFETCPHTACAANQKLLEQARGA